MLDTDADRETLAQLIATTERYCVVLQPITGGPPVDVTVETVRPAGASQD